MANEKEDGKPMFCKHRCLGEHLACFYGIYLIRIHPPSLLEPRAKLNSMTFPNLREPGQAEPKAGVAGLCTYIRFATIADDSIPSVGLG